MEQRTKGTHQEVAQGAPGYAAKHVKDGIALNPLRVMVCLTFAVQVIVGQALPLGGARPLNPIAHAITDVVSRHAGEILAWVLGVLLVCSVINRWSVCLATLLYAGYTAIIAKAAFGVDPYVGILYIAYSVLGLYVAATAWGKRGD